MNGVISNLRGKPLAINGIDDHAHLVVLLPPTLAIAEAMQKLKANTSKWVNENWAEQHGQRKFAWQAGYAAFSVSKSGIHDVVAYVENQEHHHRKFSFQEELLALLKKHEIEYDERFMLNVLLVSFMYR